MLQVPRWKQLWHRWRSLRNVPFRRSWFVGYDLAGNTYWEVINRNAPLARRQAQPGHKLNHFSDFHPPPQWLQWMRHTRPYPPTLEELVKDVQRQYAMKVLAERADQRWKSVPLKDSPTSKNADERISSAWTGEIASREEPVTQEDDLPTEVDDSQKRMREAQDRIRFEEHMKAKQKANSENKTGSH